MLYLTVQSGIVIQIVFDSIAGQSNHSVKYPVRQKCSTGYDLPYHFYPESAFAYQKSAQKTGHGKSRRKTYPLLCWGCNLRDFNILSAQGRDVFLREAFIILSQQSGGLGHFGFLNDIADIAAIAEVRLPPCRLKNRGQLFLRLIVQVQALLLGRQRRNAA